MHAFLFGGISANVSSSVNVAISGYRNEYNVSLLKSVEMVSSVSVVDLCSHLACFDGKKHRILVDSGSNGNVTAMTQPTHTYLVIITICITVIVLAVIVAGVIVSITCFVFKHKTVSVNSFYHLQFV